MGQQQIIDNLTRAGALLSQDPLRLRQTLQRNLATGKEEAGEANTTSSSSSEGLRNDIDVVARPFDKTDVHAEINHRVNHVTAVADAHLQRQGRKIPAVAGDHFRQDVVTDRAASVDANSAVVLAEQLFDLRCLLK